MKIRCPDLAVNVVVTDGSASRVARDRHAFNEDVGVVAHQIPILKSAGFAFIGIAHQVFLAGKLTRHEAPFEPRRKTGAASSTQSRFL